MCHTPVHVCARLPCVAGVGSCIAVARRTKTASSSRTPSSARWRFRTRGNGVVELDDAAVIVGAPAAPPVQGAGAAPDHGPVETPPVQAGGAAPEPAPLETRGSGKGPAEEPEGDVTLFLGDLTGAYLLANEARYRTLERFGIRREDANLATAIGVLTVANAIYERAHRPKPPEPSTAVADWTIGMGALRESIYSVAGPASRDTPLGGTLIALAILLGLTREPMRRGLHGMKASSRQLKHAFRGRYGHLVKLGRRN